MTRPLIPGERACHDCGAGLVGQKLWDAAGGRQRDEWRSLGMAKSAGHGYCERCRRAHYARSAGEQRACIRCGHVRIVKPERVPTLKPPINLCRDCQVVTADLGELARWAS